MVFIQIMQKSGGVMLINKIFIRFICAVFFLPILAGCQTASRSLSDGGAGDIEFESQGGTTLYGTVTLPQKGAGPFPAMVLMHGTGGRGYRQSSWAEFFADNGIATLNVDYFSGRGYGGHGSPPGDYYDVVDAMKVLAGHPKVDKNRIGVMGWSNGAEIALESAVIDENKGDGLTLKAHVVFYPPCELTSVPFFGPNHPIAVFVGSNDYLTKVWQCEQMVEKAVKRDHKDVRLIVYEGAHHGWDGNEHIDTYDHRSRHVKLVPDAAITAKSRRDVMEFLKRTPLLAGESS